jgi:hypothetical protein
MNKKRIAREWLLFVVFFAVGFILTPTLYFHSYDYEVPSSEASKQESTWDYSGIPKSKQTSLESMLQTFRQKYPQYDDLPDSVLLHELHQRFYSDVSFQEFLVKFNPKIDWTALKQRFIQPSMSVSVHVSGFSNFIDHLFSELYWLSTWLTVLTAYILFSFIRSIIWSLRTLRHRMPK